MNFFWKRKTDEVFLQPGDCECGHPRCYHDDGKDGCCLGPDQNDCACKIYIPMVDPVSVERRIKE